MTLVLKPWRRYYPFPRKLRKSYSWKGRSILVIDPSITDVLSAYRFLRNRVRHTPVERSAPLSDVMGTDVFIKWEQQQIAGSFKLRGALNKMFSLNEEEKKAGVVTPSSGNHAQGVAMAARMLGVRAVICVPGVCPQAKQKAIRRLGGNSVDLKVVGHFYDDAENEAERLASEEGLVFVSSYEDFHIVCGAGTVGVEMMLDEPELDLIVAPAGGGGLLNGIAIAAKALRPSVELYGVQSVASQPWIKSWPVGHVVDVEYEDSLADGLTGSIPQSLLDLSKKRIKDFVAVEEEDIARAIAFIHREHHQVAEGAGAIGVAALLADKIPVKGKKVGVVISGGNIDEDRLLQVLNNY